MVWLIGLWPLDSGDRESSIEVGSSFGELCARLLAWNPSVMVEFALGCGICPRRSVDWDERSRSHPQLSRIWVAKAFGPLSLDVR